MVKDMKNRRLFSENITSLFYDKDIINILNIINVKLN